MGPGDIQFVDLQHHRSTLGAWQMEYMPAKNDAETLAKVANKQTESEFSARPVRPVQESQAAA